ncbi:hypothetical protein [Cellulosimicrobium marinum]|uniref:hypothetical protein n=1 Tax=Cellulosimicrobium marinum TaxID=1638992 RepID=UPI001E2BD027|nr:hypothetical protein [Cellulosimicrobium marinum]MCB7138184.1 hypothetical protein [Cellulosimicrobium marinum]
MATVVPHPDHPSSTRTTPGAPPPSYAPSRPSDEPGSARSAVPVAVSLALLFGLAVAAAFVGRGIIEMLVGFAGGA